MFKILFVGFLLVCIVIGLLLRIFVGLIHLACGREF